ncbi:MAG: TetR/AcrR family transcriptional regulator [Egibacteraceae bacterium]
MVGERNASDRPTRPLRADALRNRARILAAARALFAERGPQAPTDAIAERAGVAVGTLYNHFATKEELLEAALADRVAEITALARAALERATEGADPWTEVVGLIRALAAAHMEDRALKAGVGSARASAVYGRAGGDLFEAAGKLIERAQTAGQLRGDVDAMDIVLLLGGLPGPEVTPAVRERHLDIVISGLRAP